MRSVETEILIAASAERVWAVLTDADTYADWNPFMPLLAGRLSVGERLTVRIVPPGGKPMTFRPTVMAATPARELRWLGRLGIPGLFDGEHQFTLAPKEAGTRFRQSERFSGVIAALMPASLYERTRAGFEAMNAALKARAEAGTG